MGKLIRFTVMIGDSVTDIIKSIVSFWFNFTVALVIYSIAMIGVLSILALLVMGVYKIFN